MVLLDSIVEILIGPVFHSGIQFIPDRTRMDAS
jgi:hypothetical protein